MSDQQRSRHPSLRLVVEAKLDVLLHQAIRDERLVAPGRLEASGVWAGDGTYFVVFDNLPRVARLAFDLTDADADHALLGEGLPGPGFEDITRDPRTGAWYLLIEAAPFRPGRFRPRVVCCDAHFGNPTQQWLPFDVESDNKGFEGLALVHRQGDDYLLGLCEGNRCRSGKAGRRTGGGRIQVFRRAGDNWEHDATIAVPAAVRFRDYGSLDVAGNRVVIVSQESSAIWCGTLADDTWRFADAGTVYQFPSDRGEKTRYCNAEGVAWLGPTRIVVVSDRKQADQPDRCGAKDEMIHVFELGE